MSFWCKLSRPFFVLAPMEDVTDTVFRRIIAKCGRPEVMVTEFTSVEGLASQGFHRVAQRLKYTAEEQPLVAQIWGITPEHYYQAAQIARQRGFAGLDINMGCPVKKIIQNGACSALINNPSLATEIIQAAQEGAGDIPVSVKTRLGFSEVQTEEWIGHLLKHNLAALTIHMRTVKDMSRVSARWEEMETISQMRDDCASHTLLIGNGDITSYQEALNKVHAYNLDGVMIGRGVFHNPWIFNPKIDIESITPSDKLSLLLKHIDLFQETWGDQKNIDILKKFFKVYVNGIPAASDLRARLVQYREYQWFRDIIREYAYERGYDLS